MKKQTYAIAIVLCFPFILTAQLTDMQKAAFNTYITNTPELAKYELSVREKVMNDPEIVSGFKDCWNGFRIYATLDKCKQMEDLAKIYSELGQGDPDHRNKYLPDFTRSQYQYTMAAAPGNLVKADITRHSELINKYSAGRKDKLSPENTFGSLIIQYPELVNQLRKEASGFFIQEVPDDRLILWLEYFYFKKMRNDAIKMMMEEEEKMKTGIEKCMPALGSKFEAFSEQENNTPQNWTGIFFNQYISMNFQQKGEYAFGSYVNTLGDASESSQWNLSIKGSNGDGDWTVIYEDKEKTIKKEGTIKVKLEENTMQFRMVLDKVTVNWKPGAKPYDIPIPAKGTQIDEGKLTRRQ